MNIIQTTVNAMLSGTVDLAAATIKSLLTLEDNSPEKAFLSDFPANSINHISEPFTVQLSADGGAYSSSKGVYLSANSCLFANITADYTNQTVYLYNFLDSGDPTTSRVLAWQSFYSPSIIGATTFKINDNKIFNLTDGSVSYRTLYRDFRVNLLNNDAGDLRNLPVACALLSSSYTPNITHSFYGDISAHIVSTTTIPNLYIIDGGLRTTSNYIQFPAGTGVISTVAFYVSSSTIENSKLIGYYNTGSTLSPATLTATGNVLYLKLYQNTIFDLV